MDFHQSCVFLVATLRYRFRIGLYLLFLNPLPVLRFFFLGGLNFLPEYLDPEGVDPLR